MTSILDFDFMRRALVAASLVGLIAPLIGVFLVQRRLALLGDGMGHVALTGVGLAFLVAIYVGVASGWFRKAVGGFDDFAAAEGQRVHQPFADRRLVLDHEHPGTSAGSAAPCRCAWGTRSSRPAASTTR